MKKILLITILILTFCLLPKMVKAGIIIRPVFHTGLIGYWNFQEGAGSYANDKSGYDNDGTWNGTGSHWADGKIGKGGNFNGSDDYVDVEDVGLVGEFTMSFWYYTANNNQIGIVMGEDSGTSSTTPKFGLVTNNFFVRIVTSSDTTVALPSQSNWHYVVLSRDSSDKVDLYVDGGSANRLFSDVAQTGTYTLDKIGANGDESQPFNGTIDEVRIYNRALSAGEVSRVYKLSQPKILAPTKTGLVGYWSFEENTGTKAGDMSGNGNHGTLTNMTEDDWVDGKVGGALDFDGSDDFVDISDDDSLDITDAITMEAWIKPKTSSSTRYVLAKNYAWASQMPYAIFLETDDILHIVLDNTNYNTGDAIQENVWTHIAATWDGSNIKSYLNGVEEYSASRTASLTPNVYRLLIGARNNNGGPGSLYNFNGLIDDVRIYNRALSASEVTALYKSGLAKINASQNNQLTNGLVGLWSFNGPDMDGDTAYDRSGQGNNGTLNPASPNGPTRTIGKVGQALSFDEDNDYVDAGDPANGSLDFDESTSFSIGVWIYPISDGTECPRWNNIIKKGTIDAIYANAAGSTGYFLGFSGSSSCIPWSAVDIYFKIKDGSNFPSVEYNNIGLQIINRWNHIVGTVNRTSNEMKLFVDGTQVGSTIDITGVGSLANSGSFYMSRDRYSFQYFYGYFDEVRVYNRALSAQEILRLYNMGR